MLPLDSPSTKYPVSVRMNDVTKGQARAPGPTVNDILRSDTFPPPSPLIASEYQFLGDSDLDPKRYTDPNFAAQEFSKMWSQTWQWACREEHLEDAGDRYVYDIGPYSVIISKDANGDISAFRNSCTHRGTRLVAAEGSGFGNGFTCPFHGWSWHLDGSLEQLPARWDFPHVCSEQHSLIKVACELWGGFVFINLNAEATPLSEQLEVMTEHFKHFPLDHRRIKVHVQKRLPANWKAAQEAFLEAYHNVETHNSPNGANAQYDIFGRFVTRFIHNTGTYSPESLEDYPGNRWRDPVLTESEILARTPGEPRELAANETAREVAAAQTRARLAESLGASQQHISDSEALDSIEYHLFPNMFFFPGINIPMVYRFRPDGDNVDACLFDLLIMEPWPKDKAKPFPPEPVFLDVDQSYTEVPELGWLGRVYDEDTGNLALQQQGLKAAGKGLTLGNYQEARIRRIHQTLDAFLSA
jgi:phenylpropionate dioxygenase-like ring-hydroxylating dioxygenase large terminal subunit